MAGEKSEHVKKMKKMEAEMEQVFEMKVKEKMLKLKESEADVSVTRKMFSPPRNSQLSLSPPLFSDKVGALIYYGDEQ